MKHKIFLCAQCAIHVIWPKDMKRSEEQPSDKRTCTLCGRKCYGSLYETGEEEKRA